MTVKKNDTAILKLKAAVDEKKADLKLSQRFSPITNCSLELHGERINLQVLSESQATMVLITMNTYLISAVDLGLENEYLFSGYLLEDWITDLKGKLAYLNRASEGRKLKVMENKLQELLSSEKRVELELEAMAADLDNI